MLSFNAHLKYAPLKKNKQNEYAPKRASRMINGISLLMKDCIESDDILLHLRILSVAKPISDELTGIKSRRIRPPVWKGNLSKI